MITSMRKMSAEVSHTVRVWNGLDRLMRTHQRMAETPRPGDRAALARRIAEQMVILASHLEASRLARAATGGTTPEAMRADAASWLRRAEALWAEAAEQTGVLRMVSGQAQMWRGRWVCAEPDRYSADGMCGMPVGACFAHHAGAVS